MLQLIRLQGFKRIVCDGRLYRCDVERRWRAHTRNELLRIRLQLAA
jgi:hypothetical protein